MATMYHAQMRILNFDDHKLSFNNIILFFIIKTLAVKRESLKPQDTIILAKVITTHLTILMFCYMK